ncbi:Predicted PurR-regulated permease PerM [Chitinophaga costaii]|uniref:Predicted PurR-regulated permease PerM n=2 Tax=Chitinophaga costaii TaxID=1335309 RepID=A0A1C4C9S7_9BACT|nr:AI-2E family transporter [Chitinophaga costaii]SCC15835.1 Predicted PurR-regulated permease PerM [Chitinophaga costaii]
MRSVKLAFYARLALILHALALILLCMYLGKTILIPLFFALLISFLLYPLALLMETKLKFPRPLASILSVLTFVISVGLLIFIISRQMVHLSKDLPLLQSRITGTLAELKDWVGDRYHLNDAQQMEYINKSVNGMMGGLANSIGTTFVGALESVVLFLFFLIFIYFILDHRRLLMNFVMALVNREHRLKVQEVVVSVRSLINRYIIGLLSEMLILFVLILVALLIFGIKYAVLIAVVAAVLNIIPYLGIYTAMAFSMLITYAGGSGSQAITIAIVMIVAHFIDANIILPRIVGGQVKINPLVTIVAVLTGHLVWGIPGMFLFIPLTAIIRIISEKVDELKPWAILISTDEQEL